MSRLLILIFMILLFSNCDSLRIVAINDSKTATMHSECGDIYYSLVNGLRSSEYHFSVATSFESEISEKGITIYLDEVKVDSFEVYQGVAHMKIDNEKRNNIKSKKAFYFTSLNLEEVDKIEIHFEDFIRCSGNFLELDSLIIAPIQIIEN